MDYIKKIKEIFTVDRVKLRRRIFRLIKKFASILFGSFLMAIAFNAFVIPYGLLSGGISGIALIGEYTLGIPLNISFAIMNLPVFILGIYYLNRRFIFFSLAGLFIFVFALPISKTFTPVPEVDLFLATIFSGIVGGVGCGIILKAGASTGGTDVLGMILKKKKNISIGAFSFVFNIFVICASLFLFDLKIALYTIISMWVYGKMTDMVIDGFNRNKSVMIISERSSEIADRIMEEMNRGITFLEGEGGYSGKDKKVINCVVNHYEIAKLKEICLDEDPIVFMIINETVEVHGKGF